MCKFVLGLLIKSVNFFQDETRSRIYMFNNG